MMSLEEDIDDMNSQMEYLSEEIALLNETCGNLQRVLRLILRELLP